MCDGIMCHIYVDSKTWRLSQSTQNARKTSGMKKKSLNRISLVFFFLFCVHLKVTWSLKINILHRSALAQIHNSICANERVREMHIFSAWLDFAFRIHWPTDLHFLLQNARIEKQKIKRDERKIARCETIVSYTHTHTHNHTHTHFVARFFVLHFFAPVHYGRLSTWS